MSVAYIVGVLREKIKKNKIGKIVLTTKSGGHQFQSTQTIFFIL